MTNRFKDRLATILLQLRSGGETTAVILDLSNVPTIDFTGVVALQSIINESKCVAAPLAASPRGSGFFLFCCFFRFFLFSVSLLGTDTFSKDCFE
jgi:hypothetical protein